MLNIKFFQNIFVDMTEPILKWAGGKRQLLDSLTSVLPEDHKNYNYHEPFFGGGALFFKLTPSDGSINDYNTRLINFYRVVKNNPEELISQLKKYKEPESKPNKELKYSEKNRKGKEIKNYYYQQRERFNKRPNNENYDRIEEASLLVYLNRTCYNGLYRENKSGEFNTPIGRYENPDWVREEQIRKASDALNNIDIYNKDFDYILSEVNNTSSKNIIYFDPPYKPLSETEDFTSYTSDDFGKDDQERLLNIIKELQDENKVIVSNSGVMKNIYEEKTDLNVKSVRAKRSINSDSNNRGDVEEIIAHN